MGEVDEEELSRRRNRHLILQMILLKQHPPLIIPLPYSLPLHLIQRPQLKKRTPHLPLFRHSSTRHPQIQVILCFLLLFDSFFGLGVVFAEGRG